MPKEILELNLETFEDLAASKFSEFVYFRLQGRLGNQLLGLSNAHLLSILHSRMILLDVTEVIEDSGVPIWLNRIEIGTWAVVFKDVSASRSISRCDTLDMSRFSRISEIPLFKNYSGFAPRIDFIEKSGLFKKGIFPFSTESKFEPITLGISIRAGDYKSNPHLGVTNRSYYKMALRMNALPSDSKVIIFTDDEEYAEKLLNNLPIKNWHFSATKNPIDVLEEMSTSESIIGTNSTFSFWGAFFAKSPKVVFPWPFYIANPNWNKNLMYENWITLRYLYFPRLVYFKRLVMFRIRRQLPRILGTK